MEPNEAMYEVPNDRLLRWYRLRLMEATDRVGMLECLVEAKDQELARLRGVPGGE